MNFIHSFSHRIIDKNLPLFPVLESKHVYAHLDEKKSPNKTRSRP